MSQGFRRLILSSAIALVSCWCKSKKIPILAHRRILMQVFTCLSILRAKGWPHWTSGGEPLCTWPSSPTIALSVTVGHLWADAVGAAQKLQCPAGLKPWHFFSEVSVGMRNQVTGMPWASSSTTTSKKQSCSDHVCSHLLLFGSAHLSEFCATGPNCFFDRISHPQASVHFVCACYGDYKSLVSVSHLEGLQSPASALLIACLSWGTSFQRAYWTQIK